MPRRALTVEIDLHTLRWDSFVYVGGGEGGGPTVEPYLWTGFFKIDGSNVAIDVLPIKGVGLVGPNGTPPMGTFIPTSPGRSHGNLGVNGRTRVGESTRIPPAVGRQTLALAPIPILDSTVQTALNMEDYPAQVGVVAVVMGQGNFPERAAELGHEAFNAGLRSGIAELLDGVSLGHREITDQDLSAVIPKVESGIKDAMARTLDFWEQLAIAFFGGADFLIGSRVWRFSQDDFNRRPLIWDHEAKVSDLHGPRGQWSLQMRTTTTWGRWPHAQMPLRQRGRDGRPDAVSPPPWGGPGAGGAPSAVPPPWSGSRGLASSFATSSPLGRSSLQAAPPLGLEARGIDPLPFGPAGIGPIHVDPTPWRDSAPLAEVVENPMPWQCAAGAARIWHSAAQNGWPSGVRADAGAWEALGGTGAQVAAGSFADPATLGSPWSWRT